MSKRKIIMITWVFCNASWMVSILADRELRRRCADWYNPNLGILGLIKEYK